MGKFLAVRTAKFHNFVVMNIQYIWSRQCKDPCKFLRVITRAPAGDLFKKRTRSTTSFLVNLLTSSPWLISKIFSNSIRIRGTFANNNAWFHAMPKKRQLFMKTKQWSKISWNCLFNKVVFFTSMGLGKILLFVDGKYYLVIVFFKQNLN
jgi:hypothetical protein